MSRKRDDRGASRARPRPRPGPPRAPSRPTPALEPAPALPGAAVWLAVLIAAACVACATTYPIVDTDFWQHLAVGRAIWQTHSLPHTNVWTWPTYGEPYLVQSWLYRVWLWPFWQVGGVAGL